MFPFHKAEVVIDLSISTLLCTFAVFYALISDSFSSSFLDDGELTSHTLLQCCAAPCHVKYG